MASFLDGLKKTASEIYSGFSKQASESFGGRSSLPNSMAPKSDFNILGRSLFDSLYNDGKKKIPNLVKNLRSTKTGKKLEAEAIRQKIKELITSPLTWIIGFVIFAIVFQLGRKS